MVEASSLYIHFPFCANLCNYCDFFRSKKTDQIQIANYEFELERSLQKHAEFLSQNSVTISPLKTLYIGGGTPSLWSFSGMKFLENKILNNGFSLSDDYEFTIEANPGCITEEELREWKSIGVNRVSLGLQSIDPAVLKKLDRIHSSGDSFKALELMAKHEMNYSADLMVGVPLSTNRLIKNEASKILTFGPKHISAYIFTVGKNYPHYHDLPNEDVTTNQFIDLANCLSEQGLNHYEVSNFASEGYEAIHNTKYWNSESVLALGPSATGMINLGETATRYKWRNELPKGFAVEQLKSKTFEFEKIYLKLRTAKGVSLNDLYSQFNDQSKIDDAVSSFLDKSLAEVHDGRFSLNSRGFLLMDTFLDQIF